MGVPAAPVLVTVPDCTVRTPPGEIVRSDGGVKDPLALPRICADNVGSVVIATAVPETLTPVPHRAVEEHAADPWRNAAGVIEVPLEAVPVLYLVIIGDINPVAAGLNWPPGTEIT